MASSPIKLPTYHYPLIPSSRFVSRQCTGCRLTGIIWGGYYYADLEYNDWFHKECAEAPLKIDHPSHPQHPLLRRDDKGDHRFKVGMEIWQCNLCGKKSWSPNGYYACSICDFKVDITCAFRQSSPAEQTTWPLHDHPLVLWKKRDALDPCAVCMDSIYEFSYSCLECDVHLHIGCAHFSEEVNHPCHTDHPLKLIASDSFSNEAEKICILFGKQGEKMIYHWSVCNFTTCLHCTRNPPPIVIDHTKTHKHPLTLLPKQISYACNVCGKHNNVVPYVCLQCGFMVHGGCIDLPRVININRHDHRISFTHHLGHGYSKCGVCRASLSPYYGAYTCSVCPAYAAHSKCATKGYVWDGIELEDIPEDTEDIAPFKIVGDNLIIHFLHSQHILRLHKQTIIHDEWARCEACVRPIGFDPIYSCDSCLYILHEKCANLPKKKRLVFDVVPYELVCEGGGITNIFECGFCLTSSSGYIYRSLRGSEVDVHCASLSEPFIHDGHPHPLYIGEDVAQCKVCDRESHNFMLSCDDCDFVLGLCCASLPEKIRHNIDEHPLTICCGETAYGKYWCDICEKEVDPGKWFYTCSDCGVTLHLKCVVGDFSRLMPGRTVKYQDYFFEVVLNNHNTRPLCTWCHSRCKVDIILQSSRDKGHICSHNCLYSSCMSYSWESRSKMNLEWE